MKKVFLYWIIFCIVFILCASSACAADPVLVDKIVVDTEIVTVHIGKTVDVKTSIEPQNATMKKLDWSSSDELVMTVHNGKIKGVACGEAIATATATDNSETSVSIKVVVIQPIKKITISENKVALAPGVSIQLNSVVEPADASITELKWSSSNEKVATVDSTGKVTGISKGTAKITVTATDGGGAKATITVKVEEYALVFVSKRPQNVKYTVSGTGDYSVSGSVKNGNVSIPNIDGKGWRSSSYWTESVEVTPLHPGTDVVTIKFNNKKLTYPIYVADYYAENEIQYVPVPDTSPKEENGSFRDIIYGTPYSEVKNKLIELYGNNYEIEESLSSIYITFNEPGISVAGHDVVSLEFGFVYDEDLNGYVNKDESLASFYFAEYVFTLEDNESIARNLYTKLTELYGENHYSFEETDNWDWHDDKGIYVYLYNGYASDGVRINYVWSPGQSKAFTIIDTLDYLHEREEQIEKEAEQDVFDSSTDGL